MNKIETDVQCSGGRGLGSRDQPDMQILALKSMPQAI